MNIQSTWNESRRRVNMQIGSDCLLCAAPFRIQHAGFRHFAVSWIFFCPFFLLLSLFYSVEDKQRVSTLTHIPMFLPEISIGAHDYDEKFYAYRSVRRDKMLILTVPGAYRCMSPSPGPCYEHLFVALKQHNLITGNWDIKYILRGRSSTFSAGCMHGMLGSCCVKQRTECPEWLTLILIIDASLILGLYF